MEIVSEKILQQILHEFKEFKVELQGMKAEQQDIKVELKEMRTEQQDVKVELKEMRTEQQDMKVELKEMRAEQQDIKVELNEMRAEQSLMSARLDENIQLTRAIFDRQEETDAKLEALTMDVHKMRGEITSVKEEQTMHFSILQQLAAGQARQEKILERLSFRSIEHESDIAELRRAK